MVAALGLALAGSMAPARAQEADATRQPFRIGLVVAGDAPVVVGVGAIRAAFSGVLDVPVEVIAARDFRALIDAQLDGRVDYAVYSAQAYAAASLRCECLQPVAVPLGEHGSVGIRSVLITRRGVQPRRIALGPADSLSGRIVPVALWPQADEIERAGAFQSAGSLAEAEAMFVEGAVDGMFGWVPAWRDDAAPLLGGTLARLRAAGMAAGDYEVLWRSETIPYGPHAVSSDIASDTLQKLQRQLHGPVREEVALALGDRGNGFAAIAPQDYDTLVEAISSLSNADPAD